MSFSSDVKVELSKINNLKNKQEVYAELLGYFSTANISNKGKVYKFSTENEYNINRFAKLLNNMDIKKYKIDIQGKIFTISFNNFNKDTKILLEDKIKRAYIRGAFLGGGFINNPKNEYHLEVLYKLINDAKFIKEILIEYNINAKILIKQKNIILYIKDGEEISRFLALIGANLSVLKFEEARVIRDMKNNVNRLVNCETANLNKTIGTSVRQISNIKKLKQKGIFNNLPEDLKELAILREENPNATLEELGKMLKKPISKSSVNYRFRKLIEYL